MKPPTFIIETTDHESVVNKAQAEIKKRKGRIGKDFFDVKGFEGRWRIVPEGIEITITDKPMWAMVLNDETIESEIKKYFSAGT